MPDTGQLAQWAQIILDPAHTQKSAPSSAHCMRHKEAKKQIGGGEFQDEGVGREIGQGRGETRVESVQNVGSVYVKSAPRARFYKYCRGQLERTECKAHS